MASIYSKITMGCVIQDFDEKGKCVKQEFIERVGIGDIEWWDKNGHLIKDRDWSHPFTMVQPTKSTSSQKKKKAKK